MWKVYFVYGLLILGAVAYGNYSGWVFWHSFRAGTWSPHGKSAYHK